MYRLGRLLLALLPVVVAGLISTPFVGGQEAENRAGLLIQHGDGTVFSACVAFNEPSISGLELLRRAGVSLSLDSSSGLGSIVCAVDGEGCSYPDESCFCQCQGASCTYWQYWHLVDGEWQYSGIGAADWKVTGGGVDGWVWGQGDPSGGQKPPATSFGEICAPEPSVPPPATPTQAQERGPGSTPAAAVAQTASTQPTKTAMPASAPNSGSSPTAYLVFVAIVLILAVLMARQLRRT